MTMYMSVFRVPILDAAHAFDELWMLNAARGVGFDLPEQNRRRDAAGCAEAWVRLPVQVQRNGGGAADSSSHHGTSGEKKTPQPCNHVPVIRS